MKTYLSLSSLARKANLPGPILRSRLATLSIQPDGIAVKESAEPGLLFDTERVGEILAAVKQFSRARQQPLESQIQ